MNTKAIFYAAFAPLIFLSTSCSMQTGKWISETRSVEIVENDSILTNIPIASDLIGQEQTAYSVRTSAPQLQINPGNHQVAIYTAEYRTLTAEIQQKSTLFTKKSKKGTENALAFYSFLLAILTVVPPFMFLLIPGMAALSIGAFALRQMKRVPAKYTNKWMANVGVIFGSLYSIALVAFILFAGSFGVSTLLVIPIIANFIVSMLVLSGN